MKATIYDYANNQTIIEITKEVINAVLLLISGDQALFVKYKDGDEEWFHSSSNRIFPYYDGCWFVKLHDGIDFREYKNG
jgi:hypothetical protein